MIKEYLQTLVPDRISKEIVSDNLTFIGGTSLHEISLFLIEKENKTRVITFFDYIRRLNFGKLSKK